MDYSFNVEIARRHGVAEAVFIHHLYFWIVKNEANGRHYHEDPAAPGTFRHWTYNSARALTELFPFWSEDQIRRLIRKLRENGLIAVGNFNQKGMDRTNWYALTEEVLEVYRADAPHPVETPVHPAKPPEHPAEPPDSSGESASAIPDINHIVNTDKYFAQFWELYPKKRSKGQAERAFRKIKPDASLMGRITQAIRAQAQTDAWKKDGGQYIPYPATWLSARAWEDEVAPPQRGRRRELD